MVGRKRMASVSEQKLSNGGFMRLVSCQKGAELQIYDSGGARVLRAQLPRAASVDTCEPWAAEQLSRCFVTDQLSTEFMAGLLGYVRGREPAEVMEQPGPGELEQVVQPLLDVDAMLREEVEYGHEDQATLMPEEMAVFAELGEDVGRAAASAAAAARCRQHPSASDQPLKRVRIAVERFDPAIAERGKGGWSAYDLARVGKRHERVRSQSYDELRAEARDFAAQMESLFKLVSLPDRSFNALLERVGAIVLHQAVQEETAAVGVEAEHNTGVQEMVRDGESMEGPDISPVDCIAADAHDDAMAMSSAASCSTRTIDGSEPLSFSGATCAGTECTIEIRARELTFFPVVDGLGSISSIPHTLPIELVMGVNIANTKTGPGCVLTLASDEQPLEVGFRAQSAFGAMMKEHTKARDRFVLALETACETVRVNCTARTTTVATTISCTTRAPAQRKDSARIRKGKELRDLLRSASKLYSAHKNKEADDMVAGAVEGSSGSEALMKKRAQDLRSELFTYGGLELTRGILSQFLTLPEVKLLLPESTRQAQQEVTDSKTARALLDAASKFLHEVLKSKGRRNDNDRNAFWASVVSLLPRDLLDKRMGAAAMRLLKVRDRYVDCAGVLLKAY